MATLRFTVEGLNRSGPGPDEVVRALADSHFDNARFDPCLELFSVEIDPRRHSFSDVRRAVAALGKRRGLIYLAVIMSP